VPANGSAAKKLPAGQSPGRLGAPPVYRPDVRKLAQPKVGSQPGPAGAATAPPVYRPLANPVRVQAKVVHPPQPQGPLTAGLPHSPQMPAGNVRTPTAAAPPRGNDSRQRLSPAAGAWHSRAVQRTVTVNGHVYTPEDLNQHLWDESHKEDAELVWHDEYREAVADFSAADKVFGTEIDLIMGLASASMARRAAIKEEVKDNAIAQALFDGHELTLAREFARDYDNKKNPMIPLSLMVKLRAKGWLKIHADKYRESTGGQNGMIYSFQVTGFERRKPELAEWHVHWESGKKAGSPGWKRGKSGAKVENERQEIDQLRVILGDIWGEVKSSGSGVWV